MTDANLHVVLSGDATDLIDEVKNYHWTPDDQPPRERDELDDRWSAARALEPKLWTLPDPAEFERMLREKYEPILSPDDYAQLREKCGLGAVIDGETVEPRAIGQAGEL